MRGGLRARKILALASSGLLSIATSLLPANVPRTPETWPILLVFCCQHKLSFQLSNDYPHLHLALIAAAFFFVRCAVQEYSGRTNRVQRRTIPYWGFGAYDNLGVCVYSIMHILSKTPTLQDGCLASTPFRLERRKSEIYSRPPRISPGHILNIPPIKTPKSHNTGFALLLGTAPHNPRP